MENLLFKQSALCKPCSDVISLCEMRSSSWEELSAKAPLLPRGWFELSQLSSSDRIEFTFLFWRSKWDMSSFLERGIAHFFNALEDIEIFLVQNIERGGYRPLMLYTLKEGLGFFHASTPGCTQDIARLRLQFGELPLPEDYLSFLSIHDGFGRGSEGGMITIRDFAGSFSRFQERLSRSEQGDLLEETQLIPFCEFESVHCLQCFYRQGGALMKNCYFDELLQEESQKKVYHSFSEWLLTYVHCK